MVKQLATLTVRKREDYKNTVVNALKDAGFTIVQEFDGFSETTYIIAEKPESEEEE